MQSGTNIVVDVSRVDDNTRYVVAKCRVAMWQREVRRMRIR